MSKPTRKLKPEVARKYVIGTHHTRFLHARHGEIDLTELSLQEADQLVQSGVLADYLVLKPKKASKRK